MPVPIRVALAALLLFAAAAKGQQWLADPFAKDAVVHERWALFAALQLELVLGLLWASGLWRRATWAATLALFLGFAMVNAQQVFAGKTSCGCFGQIVDLHPRLTLLLDAAVIFALLGWWPTKGELRTKPLALIVGAFLVANTLLLGGHWLAWRETGTLEEPGANGWSLVYADDWQGQPFPLADHLEDGAKLRNGKWIVCFYRQDCPACQTWLKNLDKYVRSLSEPTAGFRVLFVDVTEGGGRATMKPLLCEPDCQRGLLRPGRKWLIETPTLVELNEGRVTNVKH